ncbi:MAG: MopE-related protein, partial [Myxococcota bacterium]
SAFVSPSAAESCNDVDDDCDGEVDEDDAVDAPTWYTDADADGWGDPATASAACTAPAGAVAVAEDCDDTDGTLTPDTRWSLDYDGDGFGNPGFSLVQCERPAGYVRDERDCDDTDAAVNPDGTEVCNGYDDDCDARVDDDDAPVVGTSTWHADTDGDGFGDAARTTAACDAPDGTVADGTDCDDTDAAVSPDGDEAWYDGVDSDCDGAEDPSVCDELPGGATVAWDAACATTWGASWSVATEWTTDTSSYFDVGASYNQIMMTPVVGNLTDDDADGDIDADDIPDVAFTTFASSGYASAGYLRVVSGDGAGDTLWAQSIRPLLDPREMDSSAAGVARLLREDAD